MIINFFRQSYYALLELEIDGISHSSLRLDLKLPHFRYGTTINAGQNYESPSDSFLQNSNNQSLNSENFYNQNLNNSNQATTSYGDLHRGNF